MTRKCVMLAIIEVHNITKSFKQIFMHKKADRDKKIKMLGYSKLLRWRYKAFT